MLNLKKIGYKTKDDILANYILRLRSYYIKREKDKTETMLVIEWKEQKVCKYNELNPKCEKFGLDEIYAISKTLKILNVDKVIKLEEDKRKLLDENVDLRIRVAELKSAIINNGGKV